MDGGSVERWEKNGYGLGGVYDGILQGKWEEYDPWDASTRVDAVNNLYDGLGACTMFRMWQGWLGMSTARPREGTLLVNPLMKMSTAYTLLRPFFRAKRGRETAGYLDGENWEFVGEEDMTSELQGATMGHGQELSDELHPHLELERSMVHIPEIRPGDFVAWHCDSKSFIQYPFLSICPLWLAILTVSSNPLSRQSPQRNVRLERALHPRMPRNDTKRRIPRPAARGIPARDSGTGFPRRCW